MGEGGLDFQWADGHFALRRRACVLFHHHHIIPAHFFFMTWGGCHSKQFTTKMQLKQVGLSEAPNGQVCCFAIDCRISVIYYFFVPNYRSFHAGTPVSSSDPPTSWRLGLPGYFPPSFCDSYGINFGIFIRP